MPESSPTPTIADIAKQAKLAPTTVAAALRGETRIAASTRQRVQGLAKKMGYQRNLAASVLGSQRHSGGKRTLSVALIVHLERGILGPYAASFEAEFRRAGWLFEALNLHATRDLAAVGRRLHLQGVDAIVVGPTSPSDFCWPSFPWDRFVVLSLMRQHAAAGFDTVRVNQFSSVLKLAKEITDRGYRSIGILHGTHTPLLEEDEARLAACLLLQRRCSEKGIQLHIFERPFIGGTLSSEQTDLAVVDWMEANQLDAFIGFNQWEVNLWRSYNKRVARDSAFAALHVFLRDQPFIAGIAAPAECLAPLVALRIEQKLKLGERGLSSHPLETVTTPAFLPGESLPDAKRLFNKPLSSHRKIV